MGIFKWVKELAEDVFVEDLEEKLAECIDNPGLYSAQEVARRASNAGLSYTQQLQMAAQYGKDVSKLEQWLG